MLVTLPLIRGVTPARDTFVISCLVVFSFSTKFVSRVLTCAGCVTCGLLSRSFRECSWICYFETGYRPRSLLAACTKTNNLIILSIKLRQTTFKHFFVRFKIQRTAIDKIINVFQVRLSFLYIGRR